MRLTTLPPLLQLKSQLLSIVIRNQTLNELLGSVSEAAVSLTPSQLESLSALAVRSSMAVLQQVSGWTRGQTTILANKYMGSSKVNHFYSSVIKAHLPMFAIPIDFSRFMAEMADHLSIIYLSLSYLLKVGCKILQAHSLREKWTSNFVGDCLCKHIN